MTLHCNTVTPQLKKVLDALMSESLFAPFRLVGGTNLSLRYGYRHSDDIDMFADADYRSLDFGKFENWMEENFSYFESPARSEIVGFGRGYYVGDYAEDCVKVDLMYTDPFLSEPEIIDGIRMAGVDDIVAMKLNVVSQGGRKKDFWDIHHLLKHYTLEEMFRLHEKRYPWGHDRSELRSMFTDFTRADRDPDPDCLLGKNWDDIKLDIIESVSDFPAE